MKQQGYRKALQIIPQLFEPARINEMFGLSARLSAARGIFAAQIIGQARTRGQ